MRHLVVIVAVICAVIQDGWAQNRGSARYVPPEDFDGDITRAPRPAPTRGASVRRQRPAKAPEPTALEEEPKTYEPPQSAVRTTGRRVPQRFSTQTVSPPLSAPLPEETVPRYEIPEEAPQAPSTEPEGRPQGTRRRRPKKRRRPQSGVAKVEEEQDNQSTPLREEEKTPRISELLNEDKKMPERFQGNPTSRSNPSSYVPDPNYQPEKSSWESNSPAEQPNSAIGSQYYRPQQATNRLPAEDSEPIRNSAGYLDSTFGNAENDASVPYAPKRPESSSPNDASYVPILSPVRVPSEGVSRLPPEHFPAIRNREPVRSTVNSNYNVPLREHSNRPSVADPEEIIRNTGAKPLHNIIPQSDVPAVPLRSHSEVRLPENEKPLHSPEYTSENYDSIEDISASDDKPSEEIKESPSPSNRLPNPSEIHYDSVYPEYSDDVQGSQRIAGRRQEPEEPPARNQRPSYTSSRREAGTKPQEYDNDAEIDRRQASQYRPPLQRAGSRYRTENAEEPIRTRARDPSPSTSAPRTRGSSRYQPPEPEYVPERTRSSTRTRPDPASDIPKPRSSAAQSATRTRGTQRYAPETVESAPRTNSRGQAENAEGIARDTPSAGYVPDEEYARPPTTLSRHSQPPTNLRADSDPSDQLPVRNTLRSRPQYEVKETDPIDTYGEPDQGPNHYNYQSTNPGDNPPEDTDAIDTYGKSDQGPNHYNYQRTNQGAPQPPPPPPQPEYRVPPNRQQNRQEYQYEPPQNPRSRQQPQYQAPQNPRTESRQANNRQSPTSRPQGRSRQQYSEPSPPPRRSPGGSNFKCPDAFGFFADPVQCDKYYECRNGTSEMHLCNDGLAFNQISAPKFLRCDSIRDVDCKSRPELQEAQPTKNCPRKYGLFPHETDCTKFWNCVDGTATEVQCPPGLTYNDERATCDWADLDESSCKSEDLLGFSCPEPTTHDLLDGVYSRYAHPDNCQLHFTCIKGADGLRRPRMLSCNEGLVFDPATSSCKRPEEVPGCENFYGPAPKRKPVRQPEPEEFIEEPTPKPRRRGSNRRARN